MIPARRQKKKFSFFRILISLSAILVAVLFFWSQTKYFRSGDKLSLAVAREDGGVTLATFDLPSQTITTINIPADVQVEVSRGLGTFRLSSVWKLSVNEKSEGVLLAETITKNFRFPVYLWAQEAALGLAKADSPSLVRGIVSPYKTNLGIGDKISIALFSLGVKNTNRVNIDLGDTSYLRKQKFRDGEEGFVISGSIPQTLGVIFSDPEVSSSNYKAQIRDASGEPGIATDLGEIIEVLGPKVASIKKEETKDLDCKVAGKNSRFVLKVARVFGCKETSASVQGNFDLEITIGKVFAKRF